MGSMFSDPSCGSGPNAEKVPFVLGTARGVRCFDVDDDGFLRGITYPQVWREGENVAHCLATKYVASSGVPMTPAAFAMWHRFFNAAGRPTTVDGILSRVGGLVFPVGDAAPELDDGYVYEPCRGVERHCTCGFYAYHKELEAYYMPDRAFGVIEAYGRVILGAKGFRAQKARLIGLVPPYNGRDVAAEIDALRYKIDRFNAALEALPGSMFRTARSTKGVIALTVAAVAATAFRPVPMFYGGLIVGALTGLVVMCESHARKALSVFAESLRVARTRATDTILQLQSDRAYKAASRVEKMRTRYPNVPIFDSLEELLKECETSNLGYLADPRQEHPDS